YWKTWASFGVLAPSTTHPRPGPGSTESPRRRRTRRRSAPRDHGRRWEAAQIPLAGGTDTQTDPQRCTHPRNPTPLTHPVGPYLPRQRTDLPYRPAPARHRRSRRGSYRFRILRPRGPRPRDVLPHRHLHRTRYRLPAARGPRHHSGTLRSTRHRTSTSTGQGSGLPHHVTGADRGPPHRPAPFMGTGRPHRGHVIHPLRRGPRQWPPRSARRRRSPRGPCIGRGGHAFPPRIGGTPAQHRTGPPRSRRGTHPLLRGTPRGNLRNDRYRGSVPT